MFVRGGGGLFFDRLSNCAWQHNITPLEKSCKGPHFHVVPGFKLEQQQFSCKQILFMGAGGKSNYALLFLTPLEIGVFFLYITKEELMALIQARAAVTITSEQIDKMMMDSDENHDGMINYEEFVLIMTK